MKINIETKFESGQMVYTLSKDRKSKNYHICDTCKGSGEAKVNDKLRKCPYCNGKGRIVEASYLKEFFSINEVRISDILINTKDITDIRYDTFSFLDVSEDDLFSTKEEAVKQCYKLNKENGWTDEQIKELMED